METDALNQTMKKKSAKKLESKVVKGCNPQHILEVHISNSSLFKDLIETLKSYLNSATFVFTDDGMKLVECDEQSMVSIHLQRNFFDVYYINEPRVTLGLDINLLHKLIKSNKMSNSLVLIYSNNDRNTVQISMENINKKNMTTDYLSLYNLKQKRLKSQQLSMNEFPPELVASDFLDFCRRLNDRKSTYVTIEFTQNMVVLRGDGDTNAVIHVDLRGEDTTNFLQDIRDEPVLKQATVALKYLHMFAKASSIATMVKINLMQNCVILQYDIQNNKGQIQYVLMAEKG